jgi:hypothetical protein
MTTDVTKPEDSTQVELATTAVDGEIRDLVQLLPRSAPVTTGELGSENIAPLIAKVVAPSIAEVEKLIVELQQARTYLQSESERIRSETDRYIQLTETASESVKIISDAIRDWRQAGHPLQ